MNCPHNLYIHVPFCRSKCKYCAFYSFACLNPDWEKYANDICSELKFWSEKLGHVKIPTIFFGGGTPSLMPVGIFERIMNCIYSCFDVGQDCEITLESNPKTISHENLDDFVANGVNRLSVGVQSLNDEELQYLGRIHSVSDALDLLDYANTKGLRVSADFIYGLPSHNADSVKQLCQQINDLDLKHVSLYELTLEQGTPFYTMNLKMPDNETMANMYETISETLKLPRYEVSNYACSGAECRHNQNVWSGGAYIGIGRGGAGRVHLDNVWYDQMGDNVRFEKISNSTRAVEKIMTGLRTMRGVQLTADVKEQLNNDLILSHKDLVEIKDGYLHTTNRGLLILDEITTEIIK